MATTTESATRFFTDLTRADVPWAGGKGANLGEMTHAGVPVPGGFVVGAPTYAAFVDETGLRGRLAGLLEGLDVDDTAELERRAAEARALVAGQEMSGSAWTPICWRAWARRTRTIPAC